MSLRHEFVMLAAQQDTNLSELCRRFNISRKTGYKWIRRYRNKGPDGLLDRSRRPHTNPDQTPPHVEAAILEVRREHRAWGGRKIRSLLLRHIAQGRCALEVDDIPAPSTITAILHRNSCIDPADSNKRIAHQRFEREAPNELWQMDFKGDFLLGRGRRCFPLTVLDDHSRFSLVLSACADQRRPTVQQRLVRTFRRYGMPEAMLMDNGPPWGSGIRTEDHRPYQTVLSAWLLRLGIRVIHCRPHHPQTQGKDERFHGTLKAELLRFEQFDDYDDCQARFDSWRDTYNQERPHEALAMSVPAERYRMSCRAYPEQLPAVEYGPDDQVRKVAANLRISFHGRSFKIGRALRGQYVALRPTRADGIWSVYYCHQKIRTVDLHQPKSEH